MPPVTIIIVAWNQIEKTLACLESVAALDYPNVRTILVDNGSEPALPTSLISRNPGVDILRLRHNLGFSGGYNVGLHHALTGFSHYFLLLNNDTLLEPDILRHLVKEIESEQNIGLVTAKIYYAAEPRRIWTVGANLNVFLDLKDGGQDQLDMGQWDKPRDVDFAPFCAILVRREVIDEVGLLDEGYFLYYEDMDYCRRAQALGWRIRLQPLAHVLHDVSTSSGGRDSPMERYWMAQSSGRYFRKHGRGPRLWIIVPFRLASALKVTARLVMAQKFDALRAYWKGLWIGWCTDRATTPSDAA